MQGWGQAWRVGAILRALTWLPTPCPLLSQVGWQPSQLNKRSFPQQEQTFVCIRLSKAAMSAHIQAQRYVKAGREFC